MFSFLYKHIFKPLAFSQDPERVHETITFFGSVLGKFNVTRSLTHRMFAYEDPELQREVAGIRFKNPIGLAAGFDKNAKLIDILPYVGFGFAEFGSVTAKPCSGNPKPRLWRLPKSQALVVNYGLMNDGVDVVLERVRKSRVIRRRELQRKQNKFFSRQLGSSDGASEYRPGSLSQQPFVPTLAGTASNMASKKDLFASTSRLKGVGTVEERILENFRIGISVAKTNCKETADDGAGIADYFECFEKVNASDLADYITINVSCPNAYGGEPFTTPDKLERLSAKLKEDSWKVPVFVKLPNDYSFEELDGMLEVAVKYGYAGVILSNLTKDRVNNPVLQKSDLSKVGKGGISGKPTFERSNRLIRHAREYLNSKHTPSRQSPGHPPQEGNLENPLQRRGGSEADGVGLGSRFAIIGCGGVFSGEDAKMKLDSGADLIQMITGMIYQGPQVVGEINRYLGTRST